MNPVDGVACARPGCDNRGKPGLNIVGYGSFATKADGSGTDAQSAGEPSAQTRGPRTAVSAARDGSSSSVRPWSSAQDAAEQSCRPGRAPREDRHGESTEGRVVGVGGFRDPEHLVRRAAQPHDSASVGVLASALAVPRPWRTPAPQPRRTRALLLQFRPTAQSVAVRARNQDASHAGWSGEHAIGLGRHLHSLPCHSARSCGGRRNWRRRVAGALVAARTTNGCLINSERRKHPDECRPGSPCASEADSQAQSGDLRLQEVLVERGEALTVALALDGEVVEDVGEGKQ